MEIPSAVGSVEKGAGQKLMSETVCLQVSLGCLGTRQKVETESVDVGDADPALMHVSKDILDSAELEAVRAHDRDTRAAVRAACLPSLLRGGIYLLPLSRVEDVHERLRARKVERAALVETFLAAYDGLRAKARERLGSHYDEADYPTAAAARRAFAWTVRMMSFETPTSLRGISKALYDEQRRRAEVEWSQAVDAGRALLREEFGRLVDHMRDRMKPGEDGKRKVFRSTIVDNLAEFLGSVPAKVDVLGDPELGALAKKAAALLHGVDAQQLRDDEALRAAVAGGFDSLRADLDAAMVKRPRREIDVER